MEKARGDLSKMKNIIKKIDKTGEDIRNFNYGYHSLDMLIPGKDRKKQETSLSLVLKATGLQRKMPSGLMMADILCGLNMMMLCSEW